MKFIKTLLIVILIAVVGALVYVIMQPDTYSVKRSKVIDVPVAMAFNTVNDLKTYEEWGPWHEEDSTIVVSYGKKTVGVGARDSWTSAEGPGKMWITETVPDQKIIQKLQFDEYEPGELVWEFQKLQDSTKVTWVMRSDKAPFLFKMYAVYSGGWEKMLAPMQEKGLENLKTFLLKQKEEAKTFSFTTPKIVNPKKGTFVGFRTTSATNNEDMSEAFNTYMPMVAKQVMLSDYDHEEFTPGAVYYSWDEDNNEAELLIGLFLTSLDRLEKGDMQLFEVQSEKAVMTSKFGNYGNGDKEAHNALRKYIDSLDLELIYPVYEFYVNDPAEVKPKDIQTDIFYPVLEKIE